MAPRSAVSRVDNTNAGYGQTRHTHSVKREKKKKEEKTENKRNESRTEKKEKRKLVGSCCACAATMACNSNTNRCRIPSPNHAVVTMVAVFAFYLHFSPYRVPKSVESKASRER